MPVYAFWRNLLFTFFVPLQAQRSSNNGIQNKIIYKTHVCVTLQGAELTATTLQGGTNYKGDPAFTVYSRVETLSLIAVIYNISDVLYLQCFLATTCSIATFSYQDLNIH